LVSKRRAILIAAEILKQQPVQTADLKYRRL